MSNKKNKKKKPKVVYYDDGSTIVDMSGTRRQPIRKKPDDVSHCSAGTYHRAKQALITWLITQ